MGGDQNVSFNGQRVAHNLFMIDGAEAADRGGSGSIVMPSLDSVAEFRELTSNYVRSTVCLRRPPSPRF